MDYMLHHQHPAAVEGLAYAYAMLALILSAFGVGAAIAILRQPINLSVAAKVRVWAPRARRAVAHPKTAVTAGPALL